MTHKYVIVRSPLIREIGVRQQFDLLKMAYVEVDYWEAGAEAQGKSTQLPVLGAGELLRNLAKDGYVPSFGSENYIRCQALVVYNIAVNTAKEMLENAVYDIEWSGGSEDDSAAYDSAKEVLISLGISLEQIEAWDRAVIGSLGVDI